MMEEIVCRRMKCPICGDVLKEKDVERHTKCCNEELAETAKTMIGKYVTWKTWDGGRVVGRIVEIVGCEAKIWFILMRDDYGGEIDKSFCRNIRSEYVKWMEVVSIEDVKKLIRDEQDKFLNNAIKKLKGLRIEKPLEVAVDV